MKDIKVRNYFAVAMGAGALLLTTVCCKTVDAGNLAEALGAELSGAAKECVMPVLAWNPEENPKAWLYEASVESILPVCVMARRMELTEADQYAEVLTYDEIAKKAERAAMDAGAAQGETTGKQSGGNAAQSEAAGKQSGVNAAQAETTGKQSGINAAQGGDTNIRTDFMAHEKVRDIDPDQYDTFEELIKNFYTVDAGTKTGADELSAKLFLGQDFSVEKRGDGPQILIYHTHSLETYDAVSESNADIFGEYTGNSVVEVGERLAVILRERYGYQVLHCTESFDKESRDEAYGRALPAVTRILEENPSIQVVIDLHRDQMPAGQHLVTDIDGRPTARFMFFNGLSRTKKSGDITYLKNENLSGNLAFSFRMQMKSEEYYPGLARKIYLKSYRYNMHLKPRCLLVELGAQNNTVQEAMNACDPLAHVLDLVLSGQ